MKDKEFYINCDGIALHSKLDFPKEKKEKYPLIIIIHGLTGNMEETHIKEIAIACNSIGFATLRVDMYGHGKSEGEFRNHTIFHWVLEIMNVIDQVKSWEFVSRIYLTGHSQGGAAVVLAASLKEEVLNAIIPLSPAMMLKEAAYQGGFPNTAYDPDHLEEELLLFGEHAISSNYMKVCRMLPFEDAVKNYKKPVLIIHSDTDELVPYPYSVRLQRAYADAKLETIFNDDHCYSKYLHKVTDRIIKFLTNIEQ